MPIMRLDVVEQFAAINLLDDPGVDKGKHPIPNCVDFHIVWQLADGKVARNVLCMSVPTSFSPTAALAEQARAFLVTGAQWTAYAANLAPQTLLTAVQLRDRRQIDLPLIPSTGASTPGTSSGTALPSEMAVVGTLRTAKVGPGNRGRVYFPGFATTALGAGDVIAAATVTATTNWMGIIGGAMSAIGGTWALRQPHRNAYTSPKTGTDFDERPAGVALLTAGTVKDNHWDTQRRRGLK